MQLEYQIQKNEYLKMAWRRHCSSPRWIVGLCFAILCLFAGVALYVFGFSLSPPANDSLPVVGLLLIIFSIVLLLAQFLTPFVAFRRFYRRNPRMFGVRTVTITDNGIVSTTELGRNETTWKNYEKFQETKDLLLLYQSADVVGILPKRALANQNDLDQVKALLVSKIRRG